MSHQQFPGGAGQPPASYPQPYAPPQPVASYGYTPPHHEYHAGELDALPSIRSLTPYVPPVQRPQGQGVEMGLGVGIAQPFYAGVVPMGAQYLQSEGMMRYPVLPPDHRFRGPKKVGAALIWLFGGGLSPAGEAGRSFWSSFLPRCWGQLLGFAD